MRPPEVVEKIRMGMKRWWRDKSAKERHRITSKGTQAMRLANIGSTHCVSPETRHKISLGNTGKKRTQELRQKLSAIHTGVALSASHRSAISTAKIKSGYVPIAGIRSTSVIRESAIEKMAHGALKKLGVPFKTHVPIGERFVADIYLPKCKTVIECDGAYWHGPTRPEQKALDRRRDRFMRSLGISVIHIQEWPLREDAELAVFNALQKIRKGRKS